MGDETSSPTPEPGRRSRGVLEADARLGEPVERVMQRLCAQGLTIAEIADQIGVPPGTVGTWMVRFRITRRELLARVTKELAS